MDDITPRTRIGELLEDHPELMDVFNWYEIPVEGEDLSLTVAEFCRANELDEEDLLVEFEAARTEDGDVYSFSGDEDEDDPFAYGSDDDDDFASLALDSLDEW